MEQKRVPGTCCPDPECDKVSGQMGLAGCFGCEYLGVCQDDPQKVDYCPRPRRCTSCGADCTKCALWKAPIIDWDFSKMTEGEALYSLGIRAVEKDGKKGINLRIPGKPGKTLFIEASDEKPGCIMASPRQEDSVKGAKKTSCTDCGCEVWISPSTQEMLRRYPGTPVICLACFMKQAEKEKTKKKGGNEVSD